MATEPDKVENGVIGTLVAVLTFGVIATALAVTALVRTEEDVLAAERSGTNEAYAEMRGAQEADLNLPPAYMDQAAGVVRLPIDRAMQVVVRELRKNPAAATRVKPGEPQNGDGHEPEGAAPRAVEAGAAGYDPKTIEADEGPKKVEDTGAKVPGKRPAPKKAPGPAAPAPKPPTPAPAPVAPAPAPAPAP